MFLCSDAARAITGVTLVTDMGYFASGVAKSYPTAAEAPSYDGTHFRRMQILDLEAGVYLDEAALLEATDEDRVVYFGEQHETAPVQELELWLLQRMSERHDDACASADP